MNSFLTWIMVGVTTIYAMPLECTALLNCTHVITQHILITKKTLWDIISYVIPDFNRQFLSLRTLSLKWGYNVGANLSWKDWFSSHENYKQYHNVKRTEGRIWTLMFGCKGLSVKMGGKLPQKMMFMAQCIKKKIHMLRLKLKVWPFS